MKRCAAWLAVALLLAAHQAGAQQRVMDRIPTPFVEEGKPVTLEVVIFKPSGAGPFPTLLFNHGSTGRGDDPKLYTNTWTSEAVTRFFHERGWLVAFPQRRGRGKSDGSYAEGFETGRSGYTCSPQPSLAGLERAKLDVDAAFAYLKARSDVDAKRMLIGGQSRGGILSIAYAAERPGQFIGAINFVGGWMSDRCFDPEAINTITFRRAGVFPQPTLWLYGENDPYYSIEHSRKNFAAFTGGGGKGSFQSFALPGGKNGHLLIGSPEVWREAVSTFVGSLAR